MRNEKPSVQVGKEFSDQMTYHDLSRLIINSAIAVHRELGPGLLESIYESCLLKELQDMEINVRAQVIVPVFYKGERLGNDLRIDLLVADRVIDEVKAVEELHPVHLAQALTYLKLTNKKLGLVINFNESVLVDGVRRVINGYMEEGE